MVEDPRFDFRSNPDEDMGDTMAKADAAAANLQSSIREKRSRNELDADLRVFVAPQEPNTKFLVKAGQMDRIRMSNDLGYRDLNRDLGGGDVWAEFHSGICATRDADVVAWCEGHSGNAEAHQAFHAEQGTDARTCEVDTGLCRDADWEATPAWADMKALQQPTARRAAYIPVSTDVDRLFNRISGAVRGSDRGAGERMQEAVDATRAADAERNAR